MKSMSVAALAGAVLLSLSAAPKAHATTVDFSFLFGGSPVAEGSFSYPDGATGVLGFGDLSSFFVQFDAPPSIHGITYDSTFVSSIAPTTPPSIYFAYDSNLNAFITGDIFGSPALFGAIDFSPVTPVGFFFAPTDVGVYQEYSTETPAQPYDAFTYSLVPGPVAGAGLPGLILTIGGFLYWRRLRYIGRQSVALYCAAPPRHMSLTNLLVPQRSAVGSSGLFNGQNKL
jgi:hypothetical protein